MCLLKTRVKFIICVVAMSGSLSSLRAEENPLKNQILTVVRQQTMSEEQFTAFDKKIEKKLVEMPFSEQDLAVSSELNQIYEVYRKAIESHRANLRTQYDLGQKVIQQIQETDELSKNRRDRASVSNSLFACLSRAHGARNGNQRFGDENRPSASSWNSALLLIIAKIRAK